MTSQGTYTKEPSVSPETRKETAEHKEIRSFIISDNSRSTFIFNLFGGSPQEVYVKHTATIFRDDIHTKKPVNNIS